MSKNKFEIFDNYVLISNDDWNFVAQASIRDDYKEELMSVTWSKNGRYLYSKKLKTYLHIYIMKKWYGEETYKIMCQEDCVVDHMDNNGYNCCINNLAFLVSSENKAKGLTVDKMADDKRYMALSLFKDFETKLYQITIVYNYPAKAIISGLEKDAVVELVYLLYDCDYEIVLNDARIILYDFYKRGYIFQPEKLNNIDYHIEGCYGKAIDIESYNRMLEKGSKKITARICKKSMLKNWTVERKEEFFYLRSAGL